MHLTEAKFVALAIIWTLAVIALPLEKPKLLQWTCVSCTDNDLQASITGAMSLVEVTLSHPAYYAASIVTETASAETTATSTS
jgi:hypothetical protein